MKISARNQLSGKIISIEKAKVSGIVKLRIGNNTISSTISQAAIEELGLTEGVEATAIIKATEVMVCTDAAQASARDKLSGKIVSLTEGAVNGVVKIDIGSGLIVTSIIPMETVKELCLKEDMYAIAAIKATSVMIGI